MSKLKVFTWNMQRAECILQKSKDLTLQSQFTQRKAALAFLCANYDVGFITEPCLAFRNALKDPHSAALYPGGEWIASEQEDNQSDSSACRPLIYLRAGLQKASSPRLKTTSGNVQAQRYPATAIIKDEGLKLLLVSLHATSGGSGSNNLQDVMDEIDDGAEQGKWDAWLIGGDFNAGDAQYGGVRKSMAKSATQKKGRVLDGFFTDHADHVDCESEVSSVNHLGGNFGFVTGTGCTFNGIRVSDHAPIAAAFRLDNNEMEL